MSGKARHFYAGGNTSVGFYSLFDSVFQDVERKLILKGGPGTGKSTLMKTVGDRFLQAGFDVEFIHCASDNGSLDGFIVPSLKLGMVDGTAPHVIDPRYPGVVDEILNLGDFWDGSKLYLHKKEVIALTDEISANFASAYERFAEAKIIHDEWEQYYIEGMDFNKMSAMTDELIQKVIAIVPDKGGSGRERHLFMGAATPDGSRDFYDNLTGHLDRRFIIKGKPGSGKSTLLKKIATAALTKGYAVERYHCGFDPHSLDMILLPELSIALLDGTAPHVLDPSRPNDELVDPFLYMDQQVYEKNLQQIEEVEQRYRKVVAEGTAFLAKAKDRHDELEAIYVSAMDFERMGQQSRKVVNHFFRIGNDVGIPEVL
ncbi:PRK06851 family protein [Heliophilum fasciatum]|uniref:ATPase n=1 Tax=Heliophilum fasciatum TaxID=35700 RepID=A0A4R2RTW7_9FIRM|nr:PRK06851 family protein [Heliophilum fasciatum]MCW2278694.1 Cdc6-like AAA superfamily ATPase [Heliophilum fasciatum]TCP62585.1 hypothetical protein EDD73_1202 [Heliophilum fasciatum]